MNMVAKEYEGVLQVDNLGRITIPAAVRKALGVDYGSLIHLSVRGREVVIRPHIPTCDHCGDEIEQHELLRKLRICRKCLESVGEELKQIV